MKERTQQTHAYKLEISRTNRNGAFLCPNCGVKISPDDHSGAVYSVYETILTDDNLDELVLYCKRCLNFIHLTGFYNIHKIADKIQPLKKKSSALH